MAAPKSSTQTHSQQSSVGHRPLLPKYGNAKLPPFAVVILKLYQFKERQLKHKDNRNHGRSTAELSGEAPSVCETPRDRLHVLPRSCHCVVVEHKLTSLSSCLFASPQGGPQEGQGPLSLCDLLYTSWGGAPPFSASDMQMYERWRCRTLALRSFSSSNEESLEEDKLKRGVEKPDKIEEEEARRAEGFVLLRRCLPRGLPMDLVERTAWAECFSFFCKRECLGGFRGATRAACALQPVSLPTLVARLAHRLWFLLPGGPHFFSGSLGGASLLDVMPPWVSFLCEELAAFFMFVLLHMKALIKDGTGVYVHLTDREWSARFRQVKWLLSLDCPPPSSPPPSSLVTALNEEAVDVHASDAVFPGRGGKLYLGLPPLECIDTSLSEHFPTNPDSAPHSFWLLFDRRALSWVVCTESYALRRFPVYDGEGPPSPGAPGSKQKRRRPLPSLVDAAREDALRYLCMLGALPPSSLSGNTHYLFSLRSEAEEEEEVASVEEQQQPQQQLLLSEGTRECITDASTIHSELTPKVALPSIAAAAALNGHKRRLSEGLATLDALSPGSSLTAAILAASRLQGLQPEATATDTAAAAVTAAAADEVEELEHEAPSRAACSPTAAVRQNFAPHRHREQAAVESDSEADVQVLESPLTEEEEEEGEKPSENEERSSLRKGAPQKRKSNLQQTTEPRHKRSKQPGTHHQHQQQKQQMQQHWQQQGKQKSKKPQVQPKDKASQQQQQQHYPGLQRVIDGLLQGGQKELCGGRVLVGLRHRNGLLDKKLVSFCRSHTQTNASEGGSKHLTEHDCLGAIQMYMQQNCEKQKKAYICDASLRALTNRERLPFQREALSKALKAAGLIEHFMIDPRDLRDA
ncbi:hypothetical protein Emag_001439 [Eimeria magna]